MSKQAEKVLLPTLRFPEFRDAGDWVEKRLGDIAFEFRDGDWIESKDQSDRGVRLIQTGNIGVGEFYPKAENARYISEETFRRLGCTGIFPGDCLISRLPEPAGRSCIIPGIGGKIITAVDCTIVRFDEDQVVPYLFVVFSQTHQYMAEVGAQSSGSTRKRISRDNLSRIIIPLPKLPEQQKIADCLSSLDELISAQAQKLDALKTHKKGLMQQMFPAEGETKPRLRLSDFRDAPDWKENRLNQISPSIFDGTHQTPKYTESGVPFFSVENIVSGKANKYISRDDYLLATKKNKPELGDVIITRIGNIGFSAIVDWSYDFSIYVTLAIIKQDNRFSSHFLNFYLQSERYKSEILSKSLLNAVPQKINMDDLRKTVVLLPESSEQQKIADCLSSLDDLISAQAQKLDALKAHKKGLMQQLFPTANEVNG